MKIAMIGHKRIPGREGGVEVVVEELAVRMAEMGNRVIVYNRKSRKHNMLKNYKGICLISVPTIEHKNTEAVVYSFFASLHALFGHYDVIHYHAIGPSVFLILPHLFGIRTVVTVHGLNYKTPKWKGFASKFIQLGEKITARYADEVIVLSEEQKNYFWNKYRRLTSFIPNGVSIQEQRAPEIIKGKYNLAKNSYILFLSRLVPGKGIEYLIKAYKQINTDIPLIIAGDAPYVDDFIMRIKAEAGNDDRIRFIGFVEGHELQELYSNAKLFVFPSEAEGMPMCLLEAMSYNAPCLVSDIPENVEVGKQFCRTFKSCDTEDLARELEKCLNSSFTVEGEREYIADKYNWETTVQKTLDVYKKPFCRTLFEKA